MTSHDQVVVRLGRQRWRIRGKIQSDDSQLWEEEEMAVDSMTPTTRGWNGGVFFMVGFPPSLIMTNYFFLIFPRTIAYIT